MHKRTPGALLALLIAVFGLTLSGHAEAATGTKPDSIVTSTSATYSPVPTTGTYHYKVRAENCFGDGPWSAVKTFTVTQ